VAAIWITIFSFFIMGPLSVAQAQTQVQATRCDKKQLALKDCHLKIKNLRLHIWNDKIFLRSATQRAMIQLLPHGDGVYWEFISARELAGRMFLETAIWSAADVKTDISTLQWVIFEFSGGAIEQKAMNTIQYRKRLPGEPNTWKYDKRLSYDLGVDNKGPAKNKSPQVFWRVDKKRANL